jgi:hypothetical protein
MRSKPNPREQPPNDCLKQQEVVSSSVGKRDYLPSAAIRCASRDTFRRAALRCTIFFCAARTITGSASAMAASATDRSPAAIASSTFRTTLRKRVRRVRLIAVRRSVWRAAFFADFVLAMTLARTLPAREFCEGALIGVRSLPVNARILPFLAAWITMP